MAPRDLPTSLPTSLPQSSRSGLSVPATIGIGIGIAFLVLLCAMGAWILIRRRRRTWAANKRTQDAEASARTAADAHVSPDEEIARRVRGWEGDEKRGWEGESGDDENEKEQEGDVEKMYELASPVEVRRARVAVGARAFAVELEGSSVLEARGRGEKGVE